MSVASAMPHVFRRITASAYGHVTLPVVALLLLAWCPASAGPSFPLYPSAVKAAEIPSPGADSATALMLAPDPVKAVLDWYQSELTAAGWEVELTPGTSDLRAIAMLKKPDEKLSGSMSLVYNAEGDQTLLNIHLQGPGVSQAIFSPVPLAQPKVETPAERAARKAEADAEIQKIQQELIKKHPELAGQIRKPGEMPPSPPNSFQTSMTDLKKLLSELVKALGDWCGNPSDANTRVVLDVAARYRMANQALTGEATTWSGQAGACTASTGVFFQNVLTNIDLGMAVMGVERYRTVTDPFKRKDLLEEIRRLVRQIRDEDAQRLIAHMKVADEVVEAAKREPEAEVQGGPDTPLKKEIIARAGVEPFVPGTELVVTRLWTPTPEYWEKVLTETWTQLKCWNANCPKGCHPIEDTTLYHCKAFGNYDTANGVPPEKKHCLGEGDNYENQVKYLSHPMTLYGLVSMQIKVGDPEQLDEGGQIRYFINNQPLMTTVLDPIDRPFPGNGNPWDAQRKAAKFGMNVDPIVYEKWGEGVDFLFGEEAGEQWRNSFRAPWVTSESRGGEFNGYVLSSVIGQVFGEGGLKLHLSPPPLATGEHPLTLMMKLWGIAEKNHPALEKPSTVRIEAVVGGVEAQPVEFEIPAVFDSLRDQAEGWTGWPSDHPEKWEFGSELGAAPPKVSPPKIDVNAIAVDLLADCKKMADTYQILILNEWRKKLTSMLLNKLFTPGTKEYEGAVKDFPDIGSSGWQYVKDAVSATRNWMGKYWGDSTIQGEILHGQIGGQLANFYGEQFVDKIGADTMKSLQDWRQTNPYLISQDLTKNCLTAEARDVITYYRWQIWVNGETALKVHDKWGEVEKVSGYASIAGTAGGPAVQAYVSAILDGAQLGAYSGLLISNLYSLYEIERCMNLIYNRAGFPHSWIAQ